MINNLQSLKGRTNRKFYQNMSNHYNEMKNKIFHFEQDLYIRNAEGFNKIYHEVLLLIEFLQTKSQV